MNLAAVANVILVAGRSGSGKSTFALRYLANRKAKTIWIFDARGEYERRLGIRACRSAFDLELAVRRGIVIYDPGAFRPGDVVGAFADFCFLVMAVSAHQRGPKIVLIDEVWRYCSPRSIPQELAVMIQEGRKFEVEPVFLTQRPNLLNESILNELTEIIAFQLQGDNGLEKLENYGFNGEEIRALPPFHFIARTDQGGELRGVVRV